MVTYRRTRLKKSSSRPGFRLSDVWSVVRCTLWCLLRALGKLWDLNPVSLALARWRQLHRLNTRMTLSVRPRVVDLATDYFLSDERRQRKLLSWVKSILPWVGEVFDFTVSWQDGIVLCALMESLSPGSCPRFNLLKPHHRVNNCRLGIQLAQRYLQIPQVTLSPEEMAIADEGSEVKIMHLAQLLKWKYQKQGSSKPQTVTNVGIVEPLPCTCYARGTGIRAGIVGRRTKFNILIDAANRLDLQIEIHGPNNEYNKESVVSMYPDSSLGCSRRDGFTRAPSFSEDDGKTKVIEDGTGNSFLRQRSLDDETGHLVIPLDYQCAGEGRFLVTYIPRSAGLHYITVLSQMHHIQGSPFEVKVSDWVSSWNMVPRAQLVPFDMLQSLDQANQTLKPRVTSEKVRPKLSNMANVSKQLTMMKRRILKKVITRKGEKILCDVTPASTLTGSTPDMSEDERSREVKENSGSSSPGSVISHHNTTAEISEMSKISSTTSIADHDSSQHATEKSAAEPEDLSLCARPNSDLVSEAVTDSTVDSITKVSATVIESLTEVEDSASGLDAQTTSAGSSCQQDINTSSTSLGVGDDGNTTSSIRICDEVSTTLIISAADDVNTTPIDCVRDEAGSVHQNSFKYEYTKTPSNSVTDTVDGLYVSPSESTNIHDVIHNLMTLTNCEKTAPSSGPPSIPISALDSGNTLQITTNTKSEKLVAKDRPDVDRNQNPASTSPYESVHGQAGNSLLPKLDIRELWTVSEENSGEGAIENHITSTTNEIQMCQTGQNHQDYSSSHSMGLSDPKPCIENYTRNTRDAESEHRNNQSDDNQPVPHEQVGVLSQEIKRSNNAEKCPLCFSTSKEKADLERITTKELASPVSCPLCLYPCEFREQYREVGIEDDAFHQSQPRLGSVTGKEGTHRTASGSSDSESSASGCSCCSCCFCCPCGDEVGSESEFGRCPCCYENSLSSTDFWKSGSLFSPPISKSADLGEDEIQLSERLECSPLMECSPLVPFTNSDSSSEKNSERSHFKQVSESKDSISVKNRGHMRKKLIKEKCHSKQNNACTSAFIKTKSLHLGNSKTLVDCEIKPEENETIGLNGLKEVSTPARKTVLGQRMAAKTVSFPKANDFYSNQNTVPSAKVRHSSSGSTSSSCVDYAQTRNLTRESPLMSPNVEIARGHFENNLFEKCKSNSDLSEARCKYVNYGVRIFQRDRLGKSLSANVSQSGFNGRSLLDSRSMSLPDMIPNISSAGGQLHNPPVDRTSSRMRGNESRNQFWSTSEHEGLFQRVNKSQEPNGTNSSVNQAPEISGLENLKYERSFYTEGGEDILELVIESDNIYLPGNKENKGKEEGSLFSKSPASVATEDSPTNLCESYLPSSEESPTNNDGPPVFRISEPKKNFTRASPMSNGTNRSGHSDWSDTDEAGSDYMTSRAAKESASRYFLKGDWSPQFVDLNYDATKPAGEQSQDVSSVKLLSVSFPARGTAGAEDNSAGFNKEQEANALPSPGISKASEKKITDLNVLAFNTVAISNMKDSTNESSFDSMEIAGPFRPWISAMDDGGNLSYSSSEQSLSSKSFDREFQPRERMQAEEARDGEAGIDISNCTRDESTSCYTNPEEPISNDRWYQQFENCNEHNASSDNSSVDVLQMESQSRNSSSVPYDFPSQTGLTGAATISSPFEIHECTQENKDSPFAMTPECSALTKAEDPNRNRDCYDRDEYLSLCFSQSFGGHSFPGDFTPNRMGFFQEKSLTPTKYRLKARDNEPGGSNPFFQLADRSYRTHERVYNVAEIGQEDGVPSDAFISQFSKVKVLTPTKYRTRHDEYKTGEHAGNVEELSYFSFVDADDLQTNDVFEAEADLNRVLSLESSHNCSEHQHWRDSIRYREDVCSHTNYSLNARPPDILDGRSQNAAPWSDNAQAHCNESHEYSEIQQALTLKKPESPKPLKESSTDASDDNAPSSLTKKKRASKKNWSSNTFPKNSMNIAEDDFRSKTSVNGGKYAARRRGEASRARSHLGSTSSSSTIEEDRQTRAKGRQFNDTKVDGPETQSQLLEYTSRKLGNAQQLQRCHHQPQQPATSTSLSDGGRVEWHKNHIHNLSPQPQCCCSSTSRYHRPQQDNGHVYNSEDMSVLRSRENSGLRDQRTPHRLRTRYRRRSHPYRRKPHQLPGSQHYFRSKNSRSRKPGQVYLGYFQNSQFWLEYLREKQQSLTQKDDSQLLRKDLNRQFQFNWFNRLQNAAKQNQQQQQQQHWQPTARLRRHSTKDTFDSGITEDSNYSSQYTSISNAALSHSLFLSEVL